MINTSRTFWFVAYLLACHVPPSSPEDLKNTVVRQGETLRLSCELMHHDDTITFSFAVFNGSRASPIGHASVTSVVVTAPRDRANYRLSIDDLTQPDGTTAVKSAILEILEAHMIHAGTYACQSQMSRVTHLAEVVVLDDLRYDTNLRDSQVLLGRMFNMACNLVYAGRVVPSVTWSNWQGPIASTQRLVSDTQFSTYGPFVVSSISLQATEAMHSYRIACDASVPQAIYGVRSNLDVRAVNKPDYSLQYNSAPLIVLYEPRLSISPSQLVFRVGDQLTVTADARPAVHRLACIASIPGEADYDIENTYDVANKQIVGATISITDEMSGQKTVVQCTAVNSIDGRERTSCKNVTIIVEAAVPGIDTNSTDAAMLETPVNTVVPHGGRMRAYCMSSDPHDRIVFRHHRYSTTVTVHDNGTVRVLGAWLSPSQCAARYAVSYERATDSPSLRRAVFEIAYAQFSDAGTYSCESERNRTMYYFEVIILDGLMTCRNNLTQNAVREGDPFEFGCTVAYYGMTRPRLQWTGVNGQLTHRRRLEQPSVYSTHWARGSTFLAIQEHSNRWKHGHVYCCRAVYDFDIESSSRRWGARLRGVHAVNDPQHMTYFASEPLVIYYQPVVKVLPEHLVYRVGQTLTITALSRPAAHRYAWLDEATGKWRNGSHMYISADMAGTNNFTVVAFNRIFGVEYSSMITFKFNASKLTIPSAVDVLRSMLNAQWKSGSRVAGILIKMVILWGLFAMCIASAVFSRWSNRKNNSKKPTEKPNTTMNESSASGARHT